MSKIRIVTFVGIVLVLIPFLGFPKDWNYFFILLCGAILIAVSLSHSIRKRKVVRKTRRSKRDTSTAMFVDGHGTSPEVSQPVSTSVPYETSAEEAVSVGEASDQSSA